jgi:Family of unknown function (DUF5937)
VDRRVLIPTGSHPETTIERQLETLAQLSPEVLAQDLAEVWVELGTPRCGQQLLDAGPRGPGLLAQALWDYWEAVLLPYWPRMRAVLESDVSHRLSRLLSDRLFGLMTDLHPDVSLNGNLLGIDKPQHADAVYQASGMTIVPSVFAWPTVTLDDGDDGTFGLTYPVRAWRGPGKG